jgi:hypothetical protein
MPVRLPQSRVRQQACCQAWLFELASWAYSEQKVPRSLFGQRRERRLGDGTRCLRRMTWWPRILYQSGDARPTTVSDDF